MHAKGLKPHIHIAHRAYPHKLYLTSVFWADTVNVNGSDGHIGFPIHPIGQQCVNTIVLRYSCPCTDTRQHVFSFILSVLHVNKMLLQHGVVT